MRNWAHTTLHDLSGTCSSPPLAQGLPPGRIHSRLLRPPPLPASGVSLRPESVMSKIYLFVHRKPVLSVSSCKIKMNA